MDMNITFLYYDINSVSLCSLPLTYGKLLKRNKKALSKRMYSLIRTLESIPKFVNLIKEIRVNYLNIPQESLGWEKLRSSFKEGTFDALKAYDGFTEDSISANIQGTKLKGVKIVTESNDKQKNNPQAIPNLDTFFSNLELGLRRIYEEFTLPDSIRETLKLIILYESMLVPFSEALDQYYVSDRDLRIVKLFENKGKKMKHREIADLLGEEPQNFGIDTTVVKEAYSTAKKKIALLQKSKINA
jgi:hypothetical protein